MLLDDLSAVDLGNTIFSDQVHGFGISSNIQVVENVLGMAEQIYLHCDPDIGIGFVNRLILSVYCQRVGGV